MSSLATATALKLRLAILTAGGAALIVAGRAFPVQELLRAVLNRVVGLAATVAVTVVVTRIARRALAQRI